MLFAPPATDATTLARRLADYVVLATSPAVPVSAGDYWDMSEAAYRRVRRLAEELTAGRAELAACYQALAGAPDDCEAHRALAACLAGLLDAEPGVRPAAAGLIREADREIWIDLWQGAAYSGAEPEYPASALLPAGNGDGPPPAANAGRVTWPAGTKPLVSVLIPFRDRDQGLRTRNLLACLRALRDQARAPGPAEVMVIETDTEPRTRALIEPLADRYLHAYKDGLFNKSWAVNVGLRAAGATELTCVLDTDILVERSFLAVNTARFSHGHDAHFPYRHMLSLDPVSSDRAIRVRLGEGADAVDTATLRGLLLRDTPGACLWARTGALHRIGGFDERFEGWGGEDDDVTARLAGSGTLARFDDPLLHLHHERPAMTRDDGEFFNAHLTGAGAWTGAGGYGDPDRFAPAGRRS